MPARRTAVANQKGGTGKSTTVVSMAAALAQLSRQRVLAIDLDDQGTTTKWLGHDPVDDGLYGFFKGRRDLDGLAVSTDVERLDLIRASSELADADAWLPSVPGGHTLLRHALDQPAVRDRWDTVLIDCPGDLGVLTVIGLTAATDVLIPVAAGALEIDELPKLMQTIDVVTSRLNPQLRISGVLVCRVDIRGAYMSRVAGDVVEFLRREFPEQLLRSFVHESVRFREAPSAHEPITVYDPAGQGAVDYRAATAELFGLPAVSRA